jgi:hypothetical protein
MLWRTLVRQPAFLARFAAFFSLGVRVGFFFASFCRLSSLGNGVHSQHRGVDGGRTHEYPARRDCPSSGRGSEGISACYGLGTRYLSCYHGVSVTWFSPYLRDVK